MKLRYWRRLFIGVSAELRCCGKLMFGRAIPPLLDFANVVTAGCKRRFMVGRMAERESISASLPPKSTLFHSRLPSELNVLVG
jgi:hypothetical protein